MYLNDAEKRILDGKQGYLAQKCMQYLLAYGEAAGAECLVDIDGTVDLHTGKGNNACWTDDYVITSEEIFDAAKRGEKFKVPTFGNKPTPGFIVDGCEGCATWPTCDPGYRDHRMDQMKPLIQMGMIPTLSCNYYLTSTYWPMGGQHCSWGESSAIPWCNAVLGARTNFDGGFQMAYLGKVPKYDMHLDEKRRATVLCTYDGKLETDMDYDLFGWAASEILGNRVPALINMGKPTTSQLVKLNSSLNTGGQVRMYHIPGFTPEAPTLEAAFQGHAPTDEIVVTNQDLRRIYDMVNCARDENVEFVYLGCPHYNIIELQKAAWQLQGKKCRSELWIMTSPLVYDLAVRSSLKEVFDRAGARLMSGTCVGELRGELPDYKVMAMDAAKQNYYLSGHLYPRKPEIWYGTREECIDAAITGRWRGGWRS